VPILSSNAYHRHVSNVLILKLLDFSDEIKIGRVYLAPFDDCHYRARLDRRENENAVLVFFIDFGNFDTVDISTLIVINDEMIEQVCLDLIEHANNIIRDNLWKCFYFVYVKFLFE
jgi:hypothetical protein